MVIYRVDIKNGQYEVLKRSRGNTIHLNYMGRHRDMLTAFAEDMGRSVKAGMDAHLSKPASLSIICQALSCLTAKRG